VFVKKRKEKEKDNKSELMKRRADGMNDSSL
jgi:hypothetical protein